MEQTRLQKALNGKRIVLPKKPQSKQLSLHDDRLPFEIKQLVAENKVERIDSCGDNDCLIVKHNCTDNSDFVTYDIFRFVKI